MARKLRFVHPKTGQVFERSTNADYTHVSIDRGEARWHLSREAAARTRNEVFSLADSGPVPAPLFNDRRDGPPASAGCTVTTAVGGRCGKPAVSSFTSASGQTYHECAEHKL